MKKIIIPLILLVVGLATGYFIGHKSSEDFIDQKATFRAKILSEIGAETFKLAGSSRSRPIRKDSAELMIKDFRVQNDGSAIGMLTAKGEYIKGFYINKEPIEEILKSSATGISFYFAKHPDMIGSKKRYYTLVYVGAKQTITKTAVGSDTTYVNDGPVYDYVDPCPKACGQY